MLPECSPNQIGGAAECLLATRDAPAPAALPSDRQVLEAWFAHGIRDLACVPCSITDTWLQLAAEAHQEGRARLVTTTHEGNLPGLGAGMWFGTGRPALVHMQNSGLPNAGDGFISLASPGVCGIPMTVLVTWRGSHADDNSEPHQEIGRRVEALCEAIFDDENVFGARDGEGILQSIAAAAHRAHQGHVGAVRLSPRAFRRTIEPRLRPALSSLTATSLLNHRLAKGCDSVPACLWSTRAITRDDAIRAIVAEHPDAAILFCNGFTARAAQNVADRPGNFYNAGYMGGTLAIGWGLAASRPDLQVVVVDGDQNAQMSMMKDHLAADYPANLHWYVLANGAGTSVGTAPSLPLAPFYNDLARIVATIPDEPGSFNHPRVRAAGAYFPGVERPWETFTLVDLAHRFRAWVAEREGT
jgi:phosphonopyruvate decarboxylase